MEPRTGVLHGMDAPSALMPHLSRLVRWGNNGGGSTAWLGRDGGFDQVDQVVDLGGEFPGLVNKRL